MENKAIKEYYYDFMNERKWFMIIFGFGESRSVAYIAYITAIAAFYLYQMSLIAYGSLLVLQDRILLADAALVVVNGIFATWLLVTRLVTGKALESVRSQIISGFYKYKGEDLFEEQIQMKKDVLGEIRIRCRDFFYTWIAGGSILIIFYPILQVVTVSEAEYERLVDIANPYLPAFFYMPFTTRTSLGLSAAFIMTLLYYFYGLGAGMMMNEIYTSSILQLRVQHQLLNFSIRNLQRRAILLYTKVASSSFKLLHIDNIHEENLFQRCVLYCLRSNVQHHQVLLRFTEEMQKFNGSLLLLLINIASVAFALDLYIIVQNPSLNISFKFCVLLLLEQMYTLYMCAFGEIIMSESSKVFESLYSVPWFFYSKAFNQTLRIFMCRTMYPVRVKSLLLNFTASLETYANFTSAMYKILNLLK